MIWLIAVLVVLMVVGAVLAMAESAISRMNRVRAIALREEGRRNAKLLERIEEDPARHLNGIYLAALLVQNGSAILAAYVAEHEIGGVWIPVISFAFTILYFVAADAMAKTYAILHSDRVALALAPGLVVLSKILAAPTRLLIGVANVLLPGKGLKEGPFVSEEDIRSMADVGHEEGAIEAREREMIHSIFELGDTVVREVMVPRPDMIVVEAHRSLRRAMDMGVKQGVSRIPVYDKEPDNIVGVLYEKDAIKSLMRANGDPPAVKDVMRTPPYMIPETKKVADLLREMQRNKVHMAIVVDEYGDVAGLVTMEDILEEIVGEIADEYDVDEPDIVEIGQGAWRVRAKMPVSELNGQLQMELPDEEWDTVGGLLSGILGKVPAQGEEAVFEGVRFRAERVNGRRIESVLIRLDKVPGSERS
jgi:CBS domain containing-hemolysin-like protein